METVRGEAFERYLEIFYKRTCVDIPDDNLENQANLDDEEEPYSPDRGNGFFSISRQSNRSKKDVAPREKPPPPKPEIMSLSMSEFEPITLLEDVRDSSALPATKELDETSR